KSIEEKDLKIRKRFLLLWEREYQIRYLYLFGFRKNTIVEITTLMKMDSMSFYNKVIKNIFSIPNLSNDFCLPIYKNIFKYTPTEEQIYCGNVNYYLWDCFIK